MGSEGTDGYRAPDETDGLLPLLGKRRGKNAESRTMLREFPRRFPPGAQSEVQVREQGSLTDNAPSKVGVYFREGSGLYGVG